MDVAASDYTLTEGSTILTLKPDYLETLSAGEHMATLYYTDDRSAQTRFAIHEDSIGGNEEDDNEAGGDAGGEEDSKEESKEESGEKGTPGETGGTEESGVPVTADSNNLFVWLILLIFAAGCLMILQKLKQIDRIYKR